MVYSPRFKQLAYDMANGRDPGIGKKKGRPLDTWLNLKPEDLAHTFGIRLVVTPEGEPVILSYGQWGYSDQGSTANQKSRKKLAAAEQAESKATEQLVIFMNSTLSLSKESITGDFIEEYLLKQGDSTIEKNITTVIDKLSQQIKQTASANMGGTRTVKRWTYKHPFGHEIIGRVKMWSRQGYESAQAIKNFKPNRTGQDTGQASGKGTVGAHTGESPEFDDPEEFF
jgi:hypothetical protein